MTVFFARILACAALTLLTTTFAPTPVLAADSAGHRAEAPAPPTESEPAGPEKNGPTADAASSQETILLSPPPPTPPAADSANLTGSPFVVRHFPAATLVYCPRTGVRAEFWLNLGRYHVVGPGAHALEWAYPKLRAGGQAWVFPDGLHHLSDVVTAGSDPRGRYEELSAIWQADDRSRSEVRTAVRLYESFRGVVFEQSFPQGVEGAGRRRFEEVGCAFPVFDQPDKLPAGIRWLSYTYQDWPIPIRGLGWPARLPIERWPASGIDDSIRTPLVLYNGTGGCDVLSPLDHGIQQLSVLAPSPDRNPMLRAAWESVAARGSPSSAGVSTPAGGATGPGNRPQASLSVQPPVTTVLPGPEEQQRTEVAGDSASAAATPPALNAPQLAPHGMPTAPLPAAAPIVPSPNPAPGAAQHSSTPSESKDSVMVGSEGRLDRLPPGAEFRSVLSYGQSGVVDSVLQWGAFLQRYNGKARRQAPTDLTLHTLGYWTDNGSAYYYRTEGNATYQAVLAAVRAYHLENHIPVRYYQLDSWWYTKGSDGGTSLWTPNALVLPDGARGITRILGTPLALHNRYWSSDTPHLTGGGFTEGRGSGVPLTQAFYDRLFQTVSGWGCRLYEQDWLATQVRRSEALQTQYGAPDDWLSAMDASAGKADLAIQFCMPSIGFYLESTGLPAVTQIRTSRDFDRSSPESVRIRWMEHTQLSLLAAAVGLAPSKDVLLTTPQSGGTRALSWENTEALMAILSCGPVGLGDAFGHTDPDLVSRLCLEDGTLVQPDRPAAPVDAAVTSDADARGIPTLIETDTDIDGQSWHYLASIDVGDTRRLGENRLFRQAPLSHKERATTAIGDHRAVPSVCYDYFKDEILGVSGPGHPVDLASDPRQPGYTVTAPIESNGMALIGDISKFVTVSSTRFKEIRSTPRGMELKLTGPVGSEIDLAMFDPTGPPEVTIDGIAGSVRAREESDLSYRLFPLCDIGLYRQNLWHFRFKLPAGAAGGAVSVWVNRRQRGAAISKGR